MSASCTYTDAGGLTDHDEVTFNVVDTVAPTMQRLSLLPAPNAAGWNDSPVTATWGCFDSGSDVVAMEVSKATAGEGTDLELTGTCEDQAGNTTSDTIDGLDVDLTDPVVTIGRSPAANTAGWNNGDVTVAWTCTDALSGVTDAGDSRVLGEGADQSVTGSCTDLAGNTASAVVTDVDVDKTAPSVSWTNPITDGSSYYFGAVPSAPTCSAADSLSGLDGACTVGGYTTAVGTQTLTAGATDLAGNVSELSSSYTVMAWTLNGYYNPVDMNGVWNTVRNGSTVPLKFEVFIGATELTTTAATGAKLHGPGRDAPGGKRAHRRRRAHDHRWHVLPVRRDGWPVHPELADPEEGRRVLRGDHHDRRRLEPLGAVQAQVDLSARGAEPGGTGAQGRSADGPAVPVASPTEPFPAVRSS